MLTRPPGALQQQLINLATWLHIPLAHTQLQQQQQQGSVSVCQPDLQACGALMQLVRQQPGVLFLPEERVMLQLASIQVGL